MLPTIYEAAGTRELRQGEILSGLVHTSLTEKSLLEYLKSPALEISHEISVYPLDLAIVLSQDCDLQQDYDARRGTEGATGTLPFVLFCIAGVAEDFKRDDTLKSRELWKQFRNNKMERYQYLAPFDSEVDGDRKGFSAIGIDFKRYLTLPTELVYVQINNSARRRARLAMPFAEHLSDRFFAYHARIALPAPHFTKVEPQQ